MWSSAAGASRRRQTGRMYIPRRRRRGHDPTNPPFETLPRLPSLSGHGNGALFQDAIPGRQYLSPGHGHPLGVCVSLFQVLLYALSLHNALHCVLDPAFRHLHFRPQGRPQDSGRQTTSLSKPPEKDRTFSRGGRGTSPPQANPSETPCWLVIPERGLFTGIAIVGAVGSGKTASCMYPFAEQILAYRAEDLDRRIGGLVKE